MKIYLDTGERQRNWPKPPGWESWTGVTTNPVVGFPKRGGDFKDLILENLSTRGWPGQVRRW